ncbi:MAG: cytochrome C [Usitatibacter sp.]
MKRTLVFAAAALALATASAGASASEALAKSSGCLGCHNVEGAKKMGASFKDLAAKHKGKADAEATLVAKIGGGKGHPGTKASADDVTTLVKWVLSL